MKKILLTFLFITIQSFLNDKDDNFPILLLNNINIKIGLAKTYSINYFEKTNIIFSNENNQNDSLQVNIHSINCNININTQGEIINDINLNTFSIIIDEPLNQNIVLEPIPDIINGKYKENYEKKYCYLSINSYYLDNSIQKLIIENNDENIFYLNDFNYNLSNIIYEIKDISNESFIFLNFHFKDSQFLINVSYHIDDKLINSICKNISNSTNIYLNSDFLFNGDKSIDDNGKNGKIYINIINIDNSDINMHLKIIEKNTICLLEKNSLNYGFLTTKTMYQYYYAEIFEEEEGELMLHNKRFYGELYGKIIEKNEINKELLYNTSIYPTSFSKDVNLEFNQHYLQLIYSYENTSNCSNGCYLLITYKRTSFKDNFPHVGYEFTILSRTWTYTDCITEIVDIPYNEFIIGCFNQDMIHNHYYSIYIPYDAEKIIIEVGNNFLDIFYDEGRKKINTIKPKKNIKKLEIAQDNKVFILNIKQLKMNRKDINDISFAFKPKNHYSDIFSYYYFRILYVKENQEIYYHLDSYLGNLCIPYPNKDNEKYHCNFILKNNYRESDLKFVISSINQNEYYNITSSIIYKNNSISKDSYEFVYAYNKTIEDINYYIFQFEFKNDITKNILISFWDTVEDVYPQIYSAQMYFIDNFTKINHFKINNQYSLIYQYMYGNLGGISFQNMNENLYATRNFIGRPLGIFIDENMNYSKNYAPSEFGYFYQLIYNDKNLGTVEVNLGEPRSQIINVGQFPLYFYLELKENKTMNIVANLRLKTTDDSEFEEDFEIYGYLLSEDDITRAINEEYYDLKDPIKGYFSNAYNIGFLQIVSELKDYKYLFIEIQKNEKPRINSPILIDFITKEYTNDTFWLPINRYIFETFNGTNNSIKVENRYHINIREIGLTSQVLIELSTQYDEIKIEFDNDLNISSKIVSGFKKYRIWRTKNIDYNIFFNVINPNKINTNYMIRYYYTTYEKEYEYYFNEKFDRKDISSNNENISISLTFDSINIKKGLTKNETVTINGIYFLITGTLYKQNKNLKEIINSTSYLTEHIRYFTNRTIHYYNHSNPEKWTLIFQNIPRNNNYIYDLQLKVNAIISKSILNEELLVYKTEVNLTDIEIKATTNSNIWTYILIGIIGGIILFLAIFFIIRNILLKNKNDNLQNEIKSIVFSNDTQKNILIQSRRISETESDFQTTFI